MASKSSPTITLLTFLLYGRTNKLMLSPYDLVYLIWKKMRYLKW